MAPSTDAARPFDKRAADYGCTQTIRLDEKLSNPRQLDYLDLLPTKSNQTRALTAVAEHQGTALLYLVDGCGDAKSDALAIAGLQNQLANRSDPAWLGVVNLGSLDIYPIGFHESEESGPVKVIQRQDATAPLFFQSLVHGTFDQNNRLRGTDYVYKKIFALLTQTTNAFVPVDGSGAIDALEVLSMAGRALFFRFLIDRRIVLPDEVRGDDGICPDAAELKDAFSSATKAAQTSAWLDATFNGDFLPLIDESIPNDDRPARQQAYIDFFESIERRAGTRIFAHLEAILRGWRAVGDAIQQEFDWDELELDWGDLDFAHIPVGVLSQVYESFSHRADSRTATDTSVHYTPRTIANLMVDEAFAAVKKPGEALVLDASCGAGIFLVLAFRRLVRERWQGDNRPKTKEIQDVLYNQIRGFDISESALRLAALSLYITAIELNATRRPPQSLKFPRNLRGEVLFRFADDQSESEIMPLGSLGPDVPVHFDGMFDIVIGNPPWTRLRDRTDDDAETKQERKKQIKALNDEFTGIGRRILMARGVELPKPYENPDNNPDLPFLWKATEWAKPNGVIAMAMPARLFGRSTGGGFEAWRAVLRGIAVTGLISGADLRWSTVWKDVKVPFCLFFGRNSKPKSGHSFHFAAPKNDPEVNRDGRFRIDYEAAKAVSVERVERQPWILKTLSLGSWLDVELMEKLRDSKNRTLAERWKEWDPSEEKTGKGYDRSPKLKQKHVDFLADLLVFERPTELFDIDSEAFNTYGEQYGTNADGFSSAHRPRPKTLYQAPLVIVPESPWEDPSGAKAFISADTALAFSKSFYGYSCEGHPHASTLAALIYLLPHSTLFAYFCLMTSRRSGFDRQTFNKEEFEALPFPDIAALPTTTKSSLRRLAKQFRTNKLKPWNDLDELIFSLFGLSPSDVRVAKDTLFAASSYRRAGREALKPTRSETRHEFRESLHDALNPYFDVCGEEVAIRDAEFQPDSWEEPWFFLSVSCESETVRINPGLIKKAMEAANKRGCSRIIVNAPKRKGVVLGLLNQRRWWTITRARMCAQHIIRERLTACGLPEEA